jgi:hypothetical protein
MEQVNADALKSLLDHISALSDRVTQCEEILRDNIRGPSEAQISYEEVFKTTAATIEAANASVIAVIKTPATPVTPVTSAQTIGQ